MTFVNHFVFSAYLTSATTFLLGLFILVIKRPWRRLYVIFAAYSFGVAFWSFCVTRFAPSFDDPGVVWGRLLHIGAALVPVLFLHFVHELLHLGKSKFSKAALVAAYIAAGIFIVLDLSGSWLIRGVTNRSEYSYPTPGPLYPFFFVYFASVVVLSIGLLLGAFLRSSGARRNQLKYLLVFSSAGYLGGMKHFLILVGLEPFPLYPYGTYAIPVYVLAVMYAITRYRLLDINITLTRLAVFILVYVPLLAMPMVAGKILEPVLSTRLGTNWWLLPMGVEALFAAGGLVAYRYVQKKAEDRLLAEEREILDTLLRASRDMPRIRSIRRLVRVIVSVLGSRMRVSPIAVYLADAKGTHYTLASSRGYNPSPAEAALGGETPLVQYLQKRKEKGPVVREELSFQQRDNGAADLKDVVGQMKQLGAECVVPSFSKYQLLGFLILGAKQSRRMYTDGDLKTLETLANQAALAVENARFYEAEKEHRAQMFHEAKLASLGKTANNMSHQINNRFHAQAILAGTRVESLKALDFTKLSWGDLVQIIEQGRLTFEKIANDAIKGGDICIRFLKHTKKAPPGWFSFADAVAESASLCQYMNKDLFERLDYEKQIEEPLPQLYGQRNDLVEVLNNMTTNAYDAIEKKEAMLQDGRLPPLANGQAYRGKIRIRVASILKDSEPWVRVEFSDNGSGMTPEELEQLFTPFFTTKGAEKGTGVGTYIMQGMIQAHGGTLGVNSVYGEGTTFIILLPIKKPEVQQEGKKDGAPESPP